MEKKKKKRNRWTEWDAAVIWNCPFCKKENMDMGRDYLEYGEELKCRHCDKECKAKSEW